MSRVPEVSEKWVCALCEDHPTVDSRAAFFEHCRELHPEVMDETGKKIVAKGHVTSHMDGTDFFSWQYRWVLPDGRRLAESIVEQSRSKRDRKLWE